VCCNLARMRCTDDEPAKGVFDMVFPALALIAAASWWAPSAAHGEVGGSLSLAEAQRQALENNPSLRGAAARIDEARAGHLQTWAARLPSVRLSEQVVRSNDPVAAFGARLRQEAFAPQHFGLNDPDLAPLNRPGAITDFRTTLEISQPILSLPDQLYGRRRAESGVRAARAGLERARAQVRLQTAQAYWGLALARQALDVVQRSLETAQAHADVARAHFRQGSAPRTDVLAAEVRVAELRSEEITAANRVHEAADHLSLAMGWDPVDGLAPADTLCLRHTDAELEGLIAAALAERSDLAAVRHQTDMARHGLAGARSGRLPQVQAFAEVALDADSPVARQGEHWTVGAMATWSVFSGLQRQGEIGQARAQLAQAEANTIAMRQRLEREVRQAYRDLDAAHSRFAVAVQAVAQAGERLRVGELKYDEGLMSTTDLLDAETAWRHARILRLQALHDVSLGMARLEFAVGRPVE